MLRYLLTYLLTNKNNFESEYFDVSKFQPNSQFIQPRDVGDTNMSSS